MTKQQINHFQTLGFVLCKELFCPVEMASISTAFDAAMRLVRGGIDSPELVRDEWVHSTKRQQVVPFYDYDPEAFYPLLDDDRMMDAFEQLLGYNLSSPYPKASSMRVDPTGIQTRWRRRDSLPCGLLSTWIPWDPGTAV